MRFVDPKCLKCKKTEYVCVDSNDFDAFVKEVYGHEFEVIADVEAYNGFRKEFRGIGEYGDKLDMNDVLSEHREKDLANFKLVGMKQPSMTRILLMDLCRNGLIEAGNYLIDVSW